MKEKNGLAKGKKRVLEQSQSVLERNLTEKGYTPVNKDPG